MRLETLESRQMLYTPGDPYFDNDAFNTTDSYQWYLGRFDNPSPQLPKGINVQTAWDQLIVPDLNNYYSGQTPPTTFTSADLPPLEDDLVRFGLGDALNPLADPNIPPYFIIVFVDDGVQIDHPDLGLDEGRWWAPASCELITDPITPRCLGDGSFESPFRDQHGTAVAGLAVASRDNVDSNGDAVGIVGVAPDASWASVRLLPNDFAVGDPESFRSTDQAEAVALSRSGNETIFNNSWGPTDGVNWRDPVLGRPQIQAAGALAVGAEVFGNIYIWSAGNGREDGDNVNYDGYANSRFTIAVASIDQFGKQSAFSEPGASILVSAPSTSAFGVDDQSPPKALTTDLVFPGEDNNVEQDGDIGYNYQVGAEDPRGNPPFPPDGDPFPDVGYTSFGLWSASDPQGAFGGTSAATPLISGVVALIYDAYDDVFGTVPDPFGINPAGVISRLSYRDIQHILVNSTWKNDAGDPGTGEVGQPNGWVTNRAGRDVNYKYGFGAIDANKAIEVARSWPGIGPQRVLDTGRIDVLRAPTDPPNPDDPNNPIGKVIPDDGTQIGQIFNFDQRFFNTENSCFDTSPGATPSCTLDGVPLDPNDPDSFDPSEFPPLEYIEIEVYTDHSNAGDLEIILESPKGSANASVGTVSLLADVHDSDQNYDDGADAWTFTTARHWGELPVGQFGSDWVLKIRDKVTGNAGVLNGFRLRFYGGAINPTAVDDDVVARSSQPQFIDVLANDLGSVERTVVNEIQQITQVGTVTGGTYSITLNGATTGPIAYNASPATIASEINAVLGDSTTTGRAGGLPGTPANIEFTGNGFDRRDVAAMVLDSSGLTGGGSYSVSELQQGRAIINVPLLSARGGTLTVLPSGGILYQNNDPPTFVGTDSFNYFFTDTFGVPSNIATVNITLTEFNARPIAFDVIAGTPQGVPVVIDVLEGDPGTTDDDDFDPDGTIDRNSVLITELPFNIDDPFGQTPGTVVFDTDATSPTFQRVIFTPTPGVEGRIRFTYTVQDNKGTPSSPAAVTVQVGGIQILPPVAINDDKKSKDGEAVSIAILDNDTSSVPINPTTVEIIGLNDPDVGTADFDSLSRQLLFTPGRNAGSQVSFSYTVRDVDGFLSNPATITVGINQPPLAASFVIAATEDTSRSIALIEDHTSDIDGVVVPDSVTIVAPPVNGILTTDPITQIVTYVPFSNFNGLDSFIYYVRDNDGLRSQDAAAVINVIAVNDAPVAFDDIARTDVNTPVTLNVVLNDIDPDGPIDPLAIALPVGFGPYNGSIAIDSGSGLVTYTPNAGYVGGDSFSYFISDADGTISNRGTVTLRVGDPVSSISGVVYVDINQNGQQDPGEIPLRETKINVTVSGVGFSLTQFVRTDINGQFELVDSPATGLILPPGDYAISEVQPGLFVDGIDSPGNATPAVIENDRFAGMSFSSGDVVSGISFGETSIDGIFVARHFNSANLAGIASVALDDDTDPAGDSTPADLRLEDGAVWLSFDEGLVGSYRLSAESNDGEILVEVYQNDLTSIAASTGPAASFATVDFDGTTEPQFLRISGTGSNFELRIISIPSISSSPPVTLGASVLLNGSGWTSQFVDQFTTPGTGYQIPTGDVSQFDPLLWTGIDEISVRFSRPASVDSSDLSLRGTNGGEYAFTDFSYNVANNTATWTLAESIESDKLVVDLSNMEEFVDFGGIGSAADQLRVNILPSDANQNGVSNLIDSLQIRRRLGRSVADAGYAARFDIDGNGMIDAIDQALSYRYAFGALPVAEPGPASAPSGSPSPAAAAAITSAAVTSTGVLGAVPLRSQIRDRRVPVVNPPVVNAAVGALDAVFAQPEQYFSARRRVSQMLRGHRLARSVRVLSDDQLDNVFGEESLD